MDRLFTRRRFGQAAIAGTTLAGLAYLTGKKTLAKSTTINLVGILADVTSGTIIIKTVNIPSLKVLEGTKETVDSISSQAVGDASKAVNPLSLQVLDETKSFNKKEVELSNSLEELTGLSSVDGQLQLTTSSVRNKTVQAVKNKTGAVLGTVKAAADALSITDSPVLETVQKPNKEQKQNLLKTIGKSNSNTLTITGLGKDEKIRSVETIDKDSLVAIVAQSGVFGSGRIANISRSKGNVTSTGFLLPKTQNFSTLTQSPDGTLYASSTEPTGYTNIVQIDLVAQKVTKLVQLNFKGKVWNNGLAGLACSLRGELIALGAPRYVAKNNLYKVDIKTGALTLLFTAFDANKIAFLSSN